MTTIVSIEVTTDDAEHPRFFARLAVIDEETVDIEIPEALLEPLVAAVGSLGASILNAVKAPA